MRSQLPFLLIGFVLVSGCASHDFQDQYLLGGATEQNIALQSVRDVSEAETRPVEHGRGAGLVEANRPVSEARDEDH